MKINFAWHHKHRLAAEAHLDQRVAWHLKHAAVCGCRPIPPDILKEVQRRGIRIP